jgi:hypothetical protein
MRLRSENLLFIYIFIYKLDLNQEKNHFQLIPQHKIKIKQSTKNK